MHYVDAKSILSAKNGMNIYRGCTHGCIYCDSRSTVYGMNHKFEDIEVKRNSIELLKKSLLKRPKAMIGTGAMCDPYIPLEKHLEYMRKALELIYRYGFGFTCITKSDLILRDLDILKKINEKSKAVVQMTLTTADENLCRILEPHVCTTKRRVEVLRTLNDNDIPTVVWLTPILPYINDSEENLTALIDECRDAGVCGIIYFGAGMTLRDGDRQYFYSKLDEHFPGLREKYIAEYGDSYAIASPRARELDDVFNQKTSEYGICSDNDEIFRYLSEFPQNDRQAKLF